MKIGLVIWKKPGKNQVLKCSPNYNQLSNESKLLSKIRLKLFYVIIGAKIPFFFATTRQGNVYLTSNLFGFNDLKDSLKIKIATLVRGYYSPISRLKDPPHKKRGI